MTSTIKPTLATAAALALLASGLGACGRVGALEQPAPLFGEQAKSDYAAKQAARAAQASGTAPPATPVADQPDPDADNAPRTSRDLQAPSQQNVPISKEPIPGIPDLNGPTPSMSPPGDR